MAYTAPDAGGSSTGEGSVVGWRTCACLLGLLGIDRYPHARSRSRRACRRASGATSLAGRRGEVGAARLSRWRCMSVPFGSDATEELDRVPTPNSSLGKR
jgi:hypothetical protein